MYFKGVGCFLASHGLLTLLFKRYKRFTTQMLKENVWIRYTDCLEFPLTIYGLKARDWEFSSRQTRVEGSEVDGKFHKAL